MYFGFFGTQVERTLRYYSPSPGQRFIFVAVWCHKSELSEGRGIKGVGLEIYKNNHADG
jgi:hypothetical protein